jgi:hypothetical protein
VGQRLAFGHRDVTEVQVGEFPAGSLEVDLRGVAADDTGVFEPVNPVAPETPARSASVLVEAFRASSMSAWRMRRSMSSSRWSVFRGGMEVRPFSLSKIYPGRAHIILI